MENRHKKRTLMQIQAGLPKKICISALIMLALIALVYFLRIPNPNMILVAGLILCSALFGYGGGVTAGIIMFVYSLFFFSEGNSFVRFTAVNIEKVCVTLVGIAVDVLLVCELKNAEVGAFDDLHSLTQELFNENGRLQEISLFDGLTGIKNRVALREDYNRFLGRAVTVAMADVDNFKAINDIFGHEEGDRVLKEAAACFAEAFGRDCCYRYGGDEFLVIVPEIPEEEFQQKLDAAVAAGTRVEYGGTGRHIGISVGVSRAQLVENDSLRGLFAEADERMYRSKNGKSAHHKHMR